MWTGTKPGREAAGMAQYREITENLTQLQAEGAIRDFAWYLAGQSGPHLCIVRGEAEALMAISSAPEAMASNMKSALINEGFQWGTYATGDSVDALMGLFVQMAEQVNAS
jgi:hypothetical protein